MIRSLILKEEIALDLCDTPHDDMWHRQIRWHSHVLVDYVDCDFMTCVEYVDSYVTLWLM